jgi:SNF2 family DNA or RNA helicase
MAITQHQTRCPACNKIAIEVSRKTLGANIFLRLECGHSITRKALATATVAPVAPVVETTPKAHVDAMPVETPLAESVKPPKDTMIPRLVTPRMVEKVASSDYHEKRQRRARSAEAISIGHSVFIMHYAKPNTALALSLGHDFWVRNFPRYERPLTLQERLARAEQKEIDAIQLISTDGRKLFPYQQQTVRFMEKADMSGLILHEQGLGKTIIACSLIKRHPELYPVLVVVPSGVRIQWFAEVFRWSGLLCQVIEGSKDKPEKGMEVVLVSIDTLRLLRPDGHVITEDEINRAEARGGTAVAKLYDKYKAKWTDEICAEFKLIIVDESHKIKNPGAARTQALRKIADARKKTFGYEHACRIICMSGTNIEKHAGEFFVTLNLVRHEMFPVQTTFEMQHVATDEYGKKYGLKYPDRFRALTKDFIIRFRREDVLPDLPKIFRQFRLAEIEGDLLDQYIKVVKDFQKRKEEAEDGDRPFIPSDILGYMAKMRHITGLAKVDEAIDYLEEFLLSNDRKIVVFLHHKMTAAALMDKLLNLCKYGTSMPEEGDLPINVYNPPLQMHSGQTMEQRDQVLQEFKKDGNRILVASTAIAGTGLNMQFCSDCMIMEREWNPSTEEQAEGRFPRPGSTASKINVIYLIAAGTIDDFLTEIVETKRRAVTQTLDGKEVTWNQDSLIGELSDALMKKGLRRWKL